MIKTIFNIVLIFLVVIIQFTTLPFNKIFLNLPLCLIIYFTLYKFSFGLIWVVLAGLFFDVFSIFDFPLFTFSFLLAFLMTYFLVRQFFALQTFWSFFIISLVGITIYHLTFLTLNYLFSIFKTSEMIVFFNKQYFFYLLSSILINLGLISLLLLLTKKEEKFLIK